MAKKILVVEDRDDSRTILIAILTRFCGYETIEAANGTEAVEKAVSEKPDLILMDLDLPDISGIDAAKARKRESKHRAHSHHRSNGMELETVERKSPEGRNGGLPGKAGFNRFDESHDRKVHSSLETVSQATVRPSMVLAMIGTATR